MAGHELIDDYLNRVAQRLRGRPDAPDVVGELADHLHCAAQSRVDAGEDELSAQRAALAELGDADVVARALASERGRPAVPTSFTVTTGTLNMVAAALWVLPVLAWTIGELVAQSGSNGSEWGVVSSLFWSSGAMALMGAAALTFVFGLALHRRHGGLGWLGVAGLATLALSVPATFGAWMIPLWGGLIGIGALAISVVVLRRRIAPRLATIAFAAAVPAGAIVMGVLGALEIGPVDEWGDRPVALLGGLLTGTALMALALVGTGLWLRGEEAVDPPPVPVASA